MSKTDVTQATLALWEAAGPKKNTPAVAAPGNLGEFTSHGVKQKRRDFCYTHCGPSVWLTVCVERLANCLNFTKLGQTKIEHVESDQTS